MVFDKPYKYMIDFLAKKLRNIDSAVFIGDRIYTDFEMAKLGGLDFICVLSGETKREDLENKVVWPSLVLRSASGNKGIFR